HGLTLSGLAVRWTVALPAAAGANKSVNPPTFDNLGNVFCTTAGGVVGALTPEDGTLAGLYVEPEPVVTSAVLRGGAAYYACAEAANPDVDVDGALHSVVFGQLMTLRAGLDERGAPSAQPVYAVVTAEREACTLSLLHEPLRGDEALHPDGDADLLEGNVDIWMESCVEAWVNVPAAGGPSDTERGLFAICPSTSDHAFDIRLSIQPDGRISYVTRSLRDGVWTALTVRTDADAGIRDGRWHHVAVSRLDAENASVFVDAKLVPASAVVSTVAGPPNRDPGLKAFIGAVFDDHLEAVAPFGGLIAELRVWDAFRDVAEVAKLELVKLRGDEASLLACWNFDFGEVHDMARQGHDGELVGPSGAPAWWLSQLSFEQPSYPHVISQGTLENEGDPDKPSPQGDTRYLLLLTVLDAAGRGMADHELRLWYVRHRDDEPQSVFVTAGGAEVELFGIDPWTPARGPQPVRTGDGPASVDLTTGVAGSAKVKVRTAFGHGPAVDVRAAFMPANQRFHVSCLADEQELVKPTPPTLIAQSRLIEDYHYVAGSPVDDKSDRSTHRVVITAVNADRSLRPEEEITLWSAAPMQVEIAGAKRALTPENPVIVTANAQGECVVVVEADALTTPAIYAKAGFMHKDERIVIAPDADAARELAGLDDDTLTKPKLTVWKPNAKPSDAKVLLPPDKLVHAPKIASAVHKVMASTVPDHRMRAGRPRLLAAARPNVRPSLDHMQQPARPTVFDDASAVRSLAGAEASPMASPEAFRTALGGDLGFEFAWDAATNTLTYTALTTPAEVLSARGTPTPAPAPPTPTQATSTPPESTLELEGFFDDLWDGIKTVATDVYEGAKSLVIIIGEQIEVAIKYLDEHVVQVVVETVKDAVDAVVGFFKQLILAIEQIIAFLRALFDWDAIVGAGRQVKAMLYQAAGALPELVKPAKKVLGSLVDSVEDWLGIDRHGAAASSIAGLNATPGNSDAVGHADGVEAKSMRQKADDNAGGMRLPAGPDTIGDWPVGSDLLRPVQDGIADMFGDLASLDFAALGDHLALLFKRVAEVALESARDWINASLDGFADSLRIMLDALDRPMYIPFVSELYKWATGDELTILNLATLLIGFPVHVVYTIVTGGRRFSDDAAHWFTPHAQLTAADGSLIAADPSLGAVLDTTTKGLEVTYVVLRWVYSAYTFSADLSFSRKGNSDWRSFSLAAAGLSGSVSTFIGNITLAHYERLLTGHGADDSDVGHQILRWGPTAVGMVFDLRGLYKACRSLAANSGVKDINQPIARRDGGGGGIPNPSTPGGRIDPEASDTAEFYLLSLNAIVSIVIIGFAIAHLVDGPEFSKDTNPDSDLRTAAGLFAGQAIAMSLPKLAGPFFTHSRAGDLLENNPEVKVGIAAARFAANLAALTCHGIAVFGYMDLDW
ncbi:MAG: hypothetical protein QOJ69_2290, partial [Actinomycetota bacterium]|nr:hypothetical protein [Actinomycetota bacterium]